MKNNFSVLVILIFLFTFCSDSDVRKADNNLKSANSKILKSITFPHGIGDILSRNLVSQELYMTSPSNIQQVVIEKYKDIEYMYGVNDKYRINYIAIHDNKYITPEGCRIGSKISDYNEGRTIWEESGWAYYITLNSGWNAAFTSGRTATERFDTNTVKVEFFFRRK